MTILQTLASTIDVTLSPGLITWLYIRSWVNYMIILQILASIIDVTLDPELITW
jgi:hypothetical protein